MKKVKVDNIDISIIRALYENSRISLSELSAMAGISITAVRNRLMKVLKYGIIKRFGSDIDFSKLGYQVHAFTGIRIEPRFREDAIRKLLDNWRVLKMYEVTGDFDIVAEIIAENLLDLREFLTTEMYAIPGIIKTNTMIILKSYVTLNPFKSRSPIITRE